MSTCSREFLSVMQSFLKVTTFESNIAINRCVSAKAGMVKKVQHNRARIFCFVNTHVGFRQNKNKTRVQQVVRLHTDTNMAVHLKHLPCIDFVEIFGILRRDHLEVHVFVTMQSDSAYI